MAKPDKKSASYVEERITEITKVFEEMNKKATSFERYTLVVNEDTLMKCVKNIKHFLFRAYEQQDDTKKSGNDDEQQQRNVCSLQEKCKVDKGDKAFKCVLYIMMKLIRLHEKCSFELSPHQQQQQQQQRNTSYAHVISDVSDNVMDELVSQVQQYQIRLYECNNHKEKIYYYQQCILVYLFIIYYILKNYPLFITKRETLMKCFLKLKSFKNYPSPIGSIGYDIYSCLVKDLYLPGTTLLKELRDAYMLDIVDPNRFIFARDDFMRYIYGSKEDSNNLCKLIKDSKHLSTVKDVFACETTSTYFKEPITKLHHKHERKTLRNFSQLTMIHLIMYCAQQFLSHSVKLPKMKLQKITDYYSKMIPEYKVSGVFSLELMTTTLFDVKEHHHVIVEMFQKNLYRNTTNKSLFNSFINIVDRGLNSDYLKEFLPMVKAVKAKIDEASAVQQSQDKEKLVNVYKYMLPKIELTGCTGGASYSLLKVYMNMYMNIEDKYVKHAADVINYENYHIDKATQQRVDWFNKFVMIKRSLMFAYVKVRVICEEEKLDDVLISMYADVMKLERDREAKKMKEKERKVKEEQKAKEEEMNKRKKKVDASVNEHHGQQKDSSSLLLLHNNTNDNTTTNIDNTSTNSNKEELNPYKVNYKDMRRVDEEYASNNPNDPIVRMKHIRERNASPDVDTYMSSVILYIIPNVVTGNNNMLIQYISRHDFIYKLLISKLSFSTLKSTSYDAKALTYQLNMYLMEAKRTFKLNVYLINVKGKHQNRRRSKEYPDNLVSPDSCPYFCYSFFDLAIAAKPNETKITLYTAKNEKKVYSSELSRVKRVVGINIIPDNVELGGTKYVCGENGKELAVFFIKGDKQVESSVDMKLNEKVMMLQAVSECFLVTRLEISGCEFTAFMVDNKSYEPSITRFEVMKLMYRNSNEEEVEFKANIACFTDI